MVRIEMIINPVVIRSNIIRKLRSGLFQAEIAKTMQPIAVISEISSIAIFVDRIRLSYVLVVGGCSVLVVGFICASLVLIMSQLYPKCIIWFLCLLGFWE